MSRTVGVEEEFLLVDAVEPRLIPVGDAVAASADRRSAGQFEHELKLEQAELGTDPCASLTDLAQQLKDRRTALSASAEGHGARIAALATFPAPTTVTPTPDPRYERMGEIFGQVAAAQLTCGMHVHVSIESPDEGVAVLDRLRSDLPLVRALSSSSPFWNGADTRYASYRSILWGLWPTAGVTELFGDHAEYRRVRAQLLASGAAMDDGMLYFDARLSATYPTVEIRVADVCPYVDDAAVLAALIRAMVTTAADHWTTGQPPLPARTELLRAAHWRAARAGMTAELVDPATGGTVAAWTLVDALREQLAPALAASGDLELVTAGLSAIRERGTGAELQRQVWAERQSIADVIDAAATQTTAVG